jgi:surface protein
MNNMFDSVSVFNQPLNNWNVSNVIDMSSMFYKAFAFNQPLNNWNVANVANMTTMFAYAIVFNQNINNWNVSNVQNMLYMFQNAFAFNQPLNNWPVSSVQNMDSMFQNALVFNQPLNNWNVSNVTNMTSMFDNTNLSTNNYNAILNSWSTLTLQPNVTLGVLGLIYTSAGLIGHTNLTNSPNNWSILGDAYVPTGTNTGEPFDFTYYNTSGLISGNQYQLYYLGNPISSQVAYDGVSNTLNFTNVLITTSGIVPIVLKNNNTALNVATFTTNVQSICFKEDTKILTDKGYAPIQNLRKGDLVKTLKHDYVPISMIGRSTIHNPSNQERSKERLYKCSKEQYPELTEDLIITGCHSILVDEFTSQEERAKTSEVLTRIFVTDAKYRLPACVDERASVYEIEGAHTIYHLALENDDQRMNYGIYANGLLVETCSKRHLKEISKMELL